MQKLSRQLYFFGEFTLDLTRGCLLCGQEEVKLRPKSFEVLKYLVENNGRLISKDELIHATWVDSAVTDDSLVKCLKDIRDALHDAPHQIIKTVPRRGYIFAAEVSDNSSIAPVTALTQETAGVQVIIEEEETNGHRNVETAGLLGAGRLALLPAHKATGIDRLTSAINRHRWITAASLITLVIVVTAIVYLTRPGEAMDSVAVLPFVNVSNDPNTEYLSDGLSDSITDSLSQLPNLKKVVSFSSVLRFKGKQVDPLAVGRELNVRTVLTGRLTLRGDELLISTELLDVKDNKRLWGEQYHRKLADLLKLRGEIARDISEKLRLKLTGEQRERLTKRYTENSEAYQLYLQGRYYRHKLTDEGRIKSLEYLQKAIEKDPDFALGWAGLADTYSNLALFGQMPPKEAWQKSEEAAVKALAIDDGLSETHKALGYVKLWHDWDWAGAEREFRRAIELNPDFPNAHLGYAYLLDAVGRFDEAIPEAKRAQELGPRFGLPELEGILYHARRDDEAIADLQKVLEGTDRGPWPHLQLGEIYVQQGRYEEALAEMLKAGAAIERPRQLARIGYVYAAAGKRDEAIKILEEVKGLTSERYDLDSYLAAIYAALGNKDQAFAWLRMACDQYEYGVSDLKVSPRWDTLRKDPRFTALLWRLKLAS